VVDVSKKMGCKETVDKLQTYLDRELTETEMDEVRYHLDACPPCENFFRFEAHLKRLVWTCHAAEKAPNGLLDRISSRLREA
jgi:anti-sigma factor (TIGR02949 family)